jgi:hypothetical protein
MVPYSRRVAVLATFAALSGFGAFAQSVISTHSGVLHVSEGAVFADDQPVNQKYGTFPDLKQNSVLRTEQGRAEILLTPGVFLRVGENSAVKMIDNRLADTRVEVLKGSAVVECEDPMKVNAVTMILGDYQVHVSKSSVMELVANPAELKVFHGEAQVDLNGQLSVVHAGKMLPFNQAMAQEKFDVKNDGDELTRWSQERSEAVAVANVSAAKSLMDSGGSGMLGTGLMNTGLYSNGMMPYGSWYYNPFYSMYTYMPLNGMFYNPYGYGIFSPYTVYQVYNNPGYFTTPGSATGTSTSSGNRPHVALTSVSSFRTNGVGNGLNSGRSVNSSSPSATYMPVSSSLGAGASGSSAGFGASSVGGRSGGRGK